MIQCAVLIKQKQTTGLFFVFERSLITKALVTITELKTTRFFFQSDHLVNKQSYNK